MRQGPTRYFSIPAVLAIVILLSACDTSSTSSTSGTNQQSILQSVQHSGVLRVGTISGNAPFESIDASGNLVGYDIDIANLLAKAMGVKAQFIQTDVAGRVTILQSGKADVVFGSFGMTLKRALVIAYSDPISVENTIMMVRADRNDLNTLADLNSPNRKIALASGSTAIPLVQQQLPKAQVLALQGTADEVQAILTKQADASAFANIQVATLQQQNPGQLKVLSGILGVATEHGIGMPLGDFEWWRYVNQFVHDINRDGTTYTEGMKWFGSPPSSYSQPPPGPA